MANGKKQKGMTLLEVMVALVIFSTAALALMNSVSLNVRFTHGLADTLQASWVAENQLAEAQLTKTDFPDAETQGTEIMGGRSWNWRKQRVKTADNGWANAIRVYAEGDDSQPVIALQIVPPGESKGKNATPARVYPAGDHDCPDHFRGDQHPGLANSGRRNAHQFGNRRQRREAQSAAAGLESDGARFLPAAGARPA